MAVRRELAKNECGGASRRRRQAHVFLTAQINNLTNLQGSRKKFDKVKDFLGRGAATQQTRQFAPSKLPQGEVDGDEEKGIRADPLANCLFLPRGGTVQAVCLLRSLKKSTAEPLPFPFVDNCGNFSRKIQTNV